MDDAELVRLGDREARLQHVVRHELRRHRPVRAQHRSEILAVEQLHHDVRRAVVERADIGHPAHVLAAQLSRRPRLAREALDDTGRVDHRGVQELERDRSAERQVRGGDDDAHTALAEHALDAVLARYDGAPLVHVHSVTRAGHSLNSVEDSSTWHVAWHMHLHAGADEIAR